MYPAFLNPEITGKTDRYYVELPVLVVVHVQPKIHTMSLIE